MNEDRVTELGEMMLDALPNGVTLTEAAAGCGMCLAEIFNQMPMERRRFVLKKFCEALEQSINFEAEH